MSEEKNNEIEDKKLLSFITNRKYFFKDDNTNNQFYFKSDRSGYLIDSEDEKQPFSWNYLSDKHTLKIVLPNKKVIVFLVQEIVDEELIKVIYADKEVKRNTYLVKNEKDTKIKEIKSIDLTGFEVSYLWSDSKTQNIYSFLEGGEGVVILPDDDQESLPFKWYIDDKKIIKIGFNSQLIEIKMEEKIDDNFYIIELDDDTGRHQNINFSRITIKSENSVVLDESAERPEKIFLSFLGLTLFVFFFIILQMLFLTKGMSFLIQCAIAISITLFFILKFKSYFIMICKKDRIENKGRKFGKLISTINKMIITPVEKIIYK